MKKYYLTAVCILLATVFVTTGISWGQEAKFGFVNLQVISRKSVKAQELQKKLVQAMESKRGALETKKKELMDLNDQLQKQGAMLKQETRDGKIKEIAGKEVEYKLAEQEAQNALQNQQREVEEVFIRDITKVISKIRAQKHLAAVLNSAALFSADDAMDITEEVIKAYDADSGDAGPAPKAKPAGPAPSAGPGKPKPAPPK
ncbi:MAG: OmpH family outer membrane protein [Desulfomonile tiedjei]|uniref:OmpH family outer membrane protein n=1 Tax=Desulfomonile tiedjei TaxID=2358 RepID=A0A9D6V6M4_9BACT|nr:OmpH family outer membrane protein [Desulfomonile tiedjei]